MGSIKRQKLNHLHAYTLVLVRSDQPLPNSSVSLTKRVRWVTASSLLRRHQTPPHFNFSLLTLVLPWESTFVTTASMLSSFTMIYPSKLWLIVRCPFSSVVPPVAKPTLVTYPLTFLPMLFLLRTDKFFSSPSSFTRASVLPSPLVSLFLASDLLRSTRPPRPLLVP